MNGLVLIDKPAGCTSHDVVNRWRKLAKTKRAGHLGTLDPMATGLLALVTGTATRLAQYYGKQDKTYRAEITLGMFSDTYDAEGQITETGVAPPSDAAIVRAALARFTGRFLQTPPPVSAKKIGGVRAYKLVRQQLPVDLPPVEVEVKRLDVESVSGAKVEMLVTCSTGTYIRSMAHDLGRELGCGALLSRLRRTQAGEFAVEAAKTIAELADLAAQGRLPEVVIPSAKLLGDMPAEYFDALAEGHIRQGRDFRTSPFVVRPGAPFVKALSHSGELIAIGELKIPNLYHPVTVLS
jgi:tRNA pseudouridine55 synthase